MPAGFNDPFAEDLGTPTIGVKPQTSDPFVGDLGKPRFVAPRTVSWHENGEEKQATISQSYLEQGESDNFLNRIVKGIRDFLHIDTHKGDFPKLLAIERYGSATDENLQKIYDNLGWSPKYYDEIVSKFFNNVTLGIVPQEKLPQPTTATGKVALSLANSVSGLAGFVVADAMLGGTLDTVAKLFTQARHVGIMEKLGVLRKYAPSIASMRPRANLISSVLGSGLRLGLDTALVNIVNANERTNNIWEAIKDVEPEALQNALFGAGLPILGSVEKPVVRAMLALGLGNTTSFLVTGKTDLQGIADGIITSDPKELTESLFNTLLDVYFGYTAHTNEFKEDENTKAMGDVADAVERRYQMLHTEEQKPVSFDFSYSWERSTPTKGFELLGTSRGKMSRNEVRQFRLYPMMGNKEQLLAQKGYSDIFVSGIKSSKRVIDAFMGTGLNSNIISELVGKKPPVIKNELNPYRYNLYKQMIESPEDVLRRTKEHVRKINTILDKFSDSGDYVSAKKEIQSYLKNRIEEDPAIYLIAQHIMPASKPIEKPEDIVVDLREDYRLRGWSSFKNKEVYKRIERIGKILKEEGHVIKKMDAWKLVDQEAKPGDIVIFDPDYIGKVASYGEFAKKDKDLSEFMKKFDKIVLPKAEKGVKFIITNTWDEGLARELEERGFKVYKTERRSAKSVKPELVAVNYDKGSGRVFAISDIADKGRGFKPPTEGLWEEGQRSFAYDAVAPKGSVEETWSARLPFEVRDGGRGLVYGGIPLSEWKKPFKDLLEKHTLPTVEKDISKLTFALVDPFHAQYVVNSPEGREVFKALNKAIEVTETKMYKIRNELGDRLLALQEANTKADSHLLEIAKKALVWADKEQKDPMEYVANNYPNANRKQLQTIFNNYYNVTKYIRDATNRRTNEVIKRLKDVGVKSDKLEYMKKVMYSQIGELEYYMPRVRKPGNLIINAYKDGKRIYSKPISDVFTLVFPNRSVVAKHYEKILKERYGEDIDIEVKYPRQRLDISKLDIYSVMDAVHEALTDLPKEQARAVIDKLIENLKAQGFMAHSIRRKDELVEGYEEDPFKALQSSVSMFTGYMQKQYLRDELTEIRKVVSPRTPNLYKAINNVIDELLRQKDATDKIVNTVRGLLFIKYLGLSLRNGFVNVTFQPIFTGMHLAAEYGKGNVPNYGKAQAELAKAAADYMSGNLTEKEKRVMEKLDEWGVTKAQKTHYMLAKSALIDSLWWNKLTNAAGFIMEKTEQFNRATAALAFIRVRNRAEELTINELATLAKEFVYLTNGKYGDSNLPMMFQGKGEFKRWARIGQTFQTYNHQQLLGMLKLWKEKNRGALAAGIGLLMILGGMSTLPMYETVKEVYRHVTGGRDLEVDIANGIGVNNAYKILHEGIIGTLFGVDVSSSASLSMPTDELRFMGDSLGDKMANLVFGVGYQSVKDMFKATSYMASGDWYKAFYYGIPARFLSYPIKAMQEYRFGVTTKGDVLLVDPETGKPLQLTAKEAILQALGFTPERIARYMNTLYTFKAIDAYFQKKRTQLYNKYRVAYSKGDIDGMREAVKEMLELNERIAKLNRSGYNIAPANVERIDTIYHNKRLLQFMQSQLHY